MFRKSHILFIFFSILAAGHFAASEPLTNMPPRPLQFVVTGFDGGLNLSQWQKMRDFIHDMRLAKKPINFTYFVSGVYFLSDNNRHLYSPPKHSNGYSMIGFGEDNTKDIANRVDMMNAAFNEGQEIASHANGHFDAESDKWNLEDWCAELKQYGELLFGAFFNNKMSPNKTNNYLHGYAFDMKEVIGFRAPYLGTTRDLFPALKTFGYSYDASTTGDPTDWPQKDSNGLWRFAVPIITIAGTGKRIVNMDYNFYFAQSNANDDLVHREVYRKQMRDSYLNYFHDNYYGNRAPLFLGHHFANYQGGAYWDALKDFTQTICGLPEVRCVSYKQYLTWLESLPADTFSAYRHGHFKTLPRPTTLTYQPAPPLDIKMKLIQNGDHLRIIPSGADFSEEQMKLVLKLNGRRQWIGQSVYLPSLRKEFPEGANVEISASIINQRGVELYRASHLLKNIGTSDEKFIATPQEERAILGDLPEAHESF